MSEDLSKLAALQRLDSRIGALEQSLRDLDDGTELTRKILGAERKVVALQEAKRGKEADLKAAEQATWRIEEKTKAEKGRMDRGETRGHKEVQEAQAHLDNLASQHRRADDTVLAAMAEVERVTAEIAELEAKIVKAKARLVRVKETHKLETVRLEGELAEARELRQGATGEVPGPLLRQYDSIRQRRGVDGLVFVAEPVCPACLTSISSQQFDRLLLANTPTTCENCGRILFRADDD